jgi:hypothetical protein
LFLDPCPNPVAANLFKQGGPAVNASSISFSSILICLIVSCPQEYKSYNL